MQQQTPVVPNRPITKEQFLSGHLTHYDGSIGKAVDDVWPVAKVDHADEPPSYREHQREAVIDVLTELYVEDKDVVCLSAPTGAGKSLILYAVVHALHAIARGNAFVTTPLNSLIDQVKDDPLLHDKLTIKGRSNYTCVHPEDRGTRVNQAVCQRVSNFECEYKDRSHSMGGCPYYGRKASAHGYQYLVTNISFLMANSMIPQEFSARLPPRNVMAIDECQSIPDFALAFIGFEIHDNIPIDWNAVSRFPRESDSMERVVEWIRTEVRVQVVKEYERLSQKQLLSEPERSSLERLERWLAKVDNFLADVKDHHWTKTHDGRSISFEPVFVGRFLDSYLWDQCHKVILSSATIPPNLIEEIGLDDRDVGRVDIESTFPPERRPVVTDRAVGKMSMKHRDETIPKMAEEIGKIADEWDSKVEPGHKGIVHAHSYKMAERLYNRLKSDVKQRTRLQDADDREGSLESWKESDDQLFISVGQEEGISLDDDYARFNIVAKAAYADLRDKRVAYRMDEDTMGGQDWPWYAMMAVVALEQAAGRTTRSKTDWSITYLLDSSLLSLIRRNRNLFEQWFLDAVDIDYDEEVVSPDNKQNT